MQRQRRRARPSSPTRRSGRPTTRRPGRASGRRWRAGSTATCPASPSLAGSFTRLVTYAPFAIVSCLDGPHPAGYDDWQEGADGLRRAVAALRADPGQRAAPVRVLARGHPRADVRRRGGRPADPRGGEHRRRRHPVRDRRGGRRAARLGRAAHRRARRPRGHRRLRLRRRRDHALPRRPRPCPPRAPAADFDSPPAAAPLLSRWSDGAHGGSPANGVQPRRPARRRGRRDRRPRVHRVARPAPHLRRRGRAHQPARQPPDRRGARRARASEPTSTGTRAGRTTSPATSTTATSTSRRCSAPTRPGWRRST